MNSLNNLFNKFSDDIILLCGDFNLPIIQWNLNNNLNLVRNNINAKSSIVIDEICSCELSQFNSIKNDNNRLLDLIFFNDLLISKIIACNASLVPEDPHHKAIEFSCSLVHLLQVFHKTQVTSLISEKLTLALTLTPHQT